MEEREPALVSRSQLSPELQKLTDHNYDYPYSAFYEYPKDIYDRRKDVANDVYDIYVNKSRSWGVNYADNYFKQDEEIYRLAIKIYLRENLEDEEVSAVKGRLDKPYKGRTTKNSFSLLGQAVNQCNIQALDMLLKHGANPCLPINGDASPYNIFGFMYRMQETFHPGFSADATRLYVKYGWSPNFVDPYGEIIDNGETHKTNETFLYKMISANNELAWVALMEAGGNPWTRGSFLGSRERSIAASSADFQYLPFIDYLIAGGRNYFSPEKVNEDWIHELLMTLMRYQARDDLLTRNIQRQLKAIMALSGVDNGQAQEYLNYQPKPPEPEGYGSNPQFK